MSDVQTQYLNSISVACLRHVGAWDFSETDETWQQLIVWASPNRLLGRSMDMRGIGILWDDPRSFAPRDCRYDVGIPIDEADIPHVDEPRFVLHTAPGRYLRTTHVGAYADIVSTYERIFAGEFRYEGWKLLAQPIIEVYRDSPAEVSEDELRTDIYFPAVKK